MSVRKVSRAKSLNEEFPFKAPPNRRVSVTKKIEEGSKMMKYLDDNIIGKGNAFLGPFGRRKVVYADYMSSGRSLQFLEDYIVKEVLPAFGDANCMSSVTGLQSKLYYNDAREIIRSAVNASDEDEILFCDGYARQPMELVVQIVLNDYNWEKSPVLFVSSYEPTENLKPWIDARFQIERVYKTKEGYLDLVDLEKKLKHYTDSGKVLVGLFSAVSRLCGILADDVATTILLHQYGALSVWEYSHSAPYSLVNVNPTLPGAIKDVVLFNANKFLGGLQAPRVLIIKKKLLDSVNGNLHLNPGSIVGVVRAGLVMQLKESVGQNTIASKQEKICKQVLSHVRTIPEIILLGPNNTTVKRIPIICFLVRHSRGAFLHHRFVVAILNDVFGIQATVINHIGEVLGITGKLSVEYEQLLADDNEKCESIRPGFTKLHLPYFMSEAEIGFIMEALKMVAQEAWKLLPQYNADDVTGEWRHHSNSLVKERKALGTIRYTDGRMLFSDRRISGPGMFPQNYSECLQTARNIFNRARKMAQKSAMFDHLPLRMSKDKLEHARWFMLPGEAHKLLLGHSQQVKQTVPFDPNKVISALPSLFTMYRHNSLSALDVKRFKSKSVPASPLAMEKPQEKINNNNINNNESPIMRFSLGGEVTTLMTLPPQRVLALGGKRKERNRCHSVGATTPNGSLSFDDIINDIPQTVNERSCSCSSQTDINDYETNDSPSPSPTLQKSRYSQNGNLSNVYVEEIQAFVKEVTQELATEIKSEIREVISKVEDVLENTDMVDSGTSVTHHYFNPDDSISATEVAEYLKICTKDITSDIKTEIREMVHAVDEFIAPENNINGNRKSDLVLKERKVPVIEHQLKIKNQRHSDITDSRPNVCEVNSKQRSESYPRPNSTPVWNASSSASCPENSTPSCPYTGTISKLIDSKSTTSQDSGINMCFPETDDIKLKSKENKYPNISERDSSISSSTSSKTTTDEENSDDKSNSIEEEPSESPCSPRNETQILNTTTTTTTTTNNNNNNSRKLTLNDNDNETIKWHNLPKEIWKPSAEVNN